MSPVPFRWRNMRLMTWRTWELTLTSYLCLSGFPKSHHKGGHMFHLSLISRKFPALLVIFSAKTWAPEEWQWACSTTSAKKNTHGTHSSSVHNTLSWFAFWCTIWCKVWGENRRLDLSKYLVGILSEYKSSFPYREKQLKLVCKLVLFNFFF